MEELEQILIAHAKRYPAMRPADAVKLIYQNEFGGGHMIRNEQACLNYLRTEYESTKKNPEVPLYEDIGNGIIRVNLASVRETDIKQLGMDFIRSAAAHKGEIRSFQEKLKVLCKVTENGCFCFGIDELQAYLVEYKAAGYPAVSHSQAYRDAYKPAYRIVLRTLKNNWSL